MQRRNVVLLLAPMAGFIIIGCGGSKKMVRSGSFTVVSTRNVELSKVTGASRKIKARGVEGTYLVDPLEFDRHKAAAASVRPLHHEIVRGIERRKIVDNDTWQRRVCIRGAPACRRKGKISVARHGAAKKHQGKDTHTAEE